jgi:hypothetical protein
LGGILHLLHELEYQKLRSPSHDHQESTAGTRRIFEAILDAGNDWFLLKIAMPQLTLQNIQSRPAESISLLQTNKACQLSGNGLPVSPVTKKKQTHNTQNRTCEAKLMRLSDVVSILPKQAFDTPSNSSACTDLFALTGFP